MTLLSDDRLAAVTPLPVTVRTRVTVPLRFPDGYATTAEVFTFSGLADGKEHLLLGLGDWRAASGPPARGRAAPPLPPPRQRLTGGHFRAERRGRGPQPPRAAPRTHEARGVPPH